MEKPEKTKCESCGMPIESGPYCSYCVDESGKLQPFEERFERMVQFQLRQDPKLDRAAAEELQDWLTDLLTDLRHLARERHLDFAQSERLSEGHFQTEVGEEGGAS